MSLVEPTLEARHVAVELGGARRFLRKPVVDAREEGARTHAVDADAVAGVLDRPDLGELDHRRLGGAVGRRM